MKRKHILLAVAAVLAVVGWWFARSAWRTHPVPESSLGVGLGAPPGPPSAGQIQAIHGPSGGAGPEAQPVGTDPDRRLRPPEPNRRFVDFTPEQRVEFARRGHGPGG